MEIKAIGFDYGGVIAGISGPEFERRVTSLLGVELKTFQDVYFKFNHLMNNNVLSLEDFWKKVTEELRVSDKHHDLMEFVRALPHREVNKQVIDLVDILRANGYKAGLLSNNVITAAGGFQKDGLFDHFDAVVISAEIGYSKPHPKAFEIFIERLGVAADELIFIDDTERNFINANEIGFRPILFSDYQSLVAELINLGIKI